MTNQKIKNNVSAWFVIWVVLFVANILLYLTLYLVMSWGSSTGTADGIMQGFAVLPYLFGLMVVDLIVAVIYLLTHYRKH